MNLHGAAGGVALAIVGLFVIGTMGEVPAAQAEPTEARPLRDASAGTLANDRALANAGLKLSATPAEEMSGACPTGTLEVEGEYCPWLDQRCLRWLDPDTKMRCAEFAASGKCQTKTRHLHFCIDRYEYPNVAGERPLVMKTWYEAQDTCKAQGKRLCLDSEWTLACEGQERAPYPYGHARSSEACNIDRMNPTPNEILLANPQTKGAEVERLWQGEPSGKRDSCVSAYGVHDMTGNVDEWVVNETGLPYKSGLKGGYWGQVRTRCRPMTTAHYEQFSFYQVGFRCCADAAKVAPAANRAGPVENMVRPVKAKAPATTVGS